MEAGEYSPVAPPPPPPSLTSSQSYDSRERGLDRKGAVIPRGGYMEEPVRIHAKETTSKVPRRDAETYPQKFMFYVKFMFDYLQFFKLVFLADRGHLNDLYFSKFSFLATELTSTCVCQLNPYSIFSETLIIYFTKHQDMKRPPNNVQVMDICS